MIRMCNADHLGHKRQDPKGENHIRQSPDLAMPWQFPIPDQQGLGDQHTNPDPGHQGVQVDKGRDVLPEIGDLIEICLVEGQPG